MRNKDWTLVFFTVLSQLSVGIILCFTWLAFFEVETRFVGLTGLDSTNPVLLALLFVGVATVVSPLHLGKPSNAPRSLNNLKGSWVSREILALAVYSTSLVVILVLGLNFQRFEFLPHLLVLSSVFGILFIWMMTRIYLIPTIPPWNSAYTGLSFASTAVCLGLVTILLLQYAGLVRAGCVTCVAQFVDDRVHAVLMVALGLVLLLELVSGFVHQTRLTGMSGGIESVVFGEGKYHRLFHFRMILLGLTILLLTIILFRPAVLAGHGSQPWLLLLPGLVFMQAFAGRLLFFSSYFRIGV